MAALILSNNELKCVLILADAGSKLTDTVCGVHLSDLSNLIRNHLLANDADLSGLHGIPGIDRTFIKVKLEYSMDNKVPPIKLVRELLGWGLQKAHQLVNGGVVEGNQRSNLHHVILEDVPKSKFVRIQKGTVSAIGYQISEVQ